MSIRRLLVNYDYDKEVDRVECSGIRAVNSSIQELYIYNPKVREPLHKFWYMIDTAKLEKKSSAGRSARVVISSRDENLIASLKSLDVKIDELVKKLRTKRDLKIRSLLGMSEHYPPTLDVSLDERTVALDPNGESINFMTIGNGSKIKLMIELDRLIFERGIVRKIWRIIQVKQIEDISTHIDLFASLDIEIEPTRSLRPPAPPPMPVTNMPPPPDRGPISLADLSSVKLKPSISNDSKKDGNTNQNRGFQPPTSNQLQDMIKRLKRADTESVSEDEGPIDEQSIDEQSIDEQSIDEQSLNEESIDQGTFDEDSDEENEIESANETDDDSEDPFAMADTSEAEPEIDESDKDSEDSEESFDPFAPPKKKKIVKTKPKGKSKGKSKANNKPSKKEHSKTNLRVKKSRSIATKKTKSKQKRK